jgi:hypothetical protein
MHILILEALGLLAWLLVGLLVAVAFGPSKSSFSVRARVTEQRPRWRITCSCGWERSASSAWAATAIAALHARHPADPSTEHTITVEEPPADAAGRRYRVPADTPGIRPKGRGCSREAAWGSFSSPCAVSSEPVRARP